MVQPEATQPGQRKIVIVAGSNRTGTSLLVQILCRKGFAVPEGPRVASDEYDVYENEEFKRISRHWHQEAAQRFARSLKGERIILKYPKSSYVIHRWLRVINDARVVYVFRPREEAVESQVRNWWRPRLFAFLGRWIYRFEWLRGYLAMSNLPAPVCFVTFQELKATQDLRFPESWGWND